MSALSALFHLGTNKFIINNIPYINERKMKKTFSLALLILLISAISKAQSIPNNGFENWTSMGNYNNPDSWSTLNDMTSTMSIFTCVKGTPGTVEAAYIKLTSKTVTGMGVMPGITVCGEVDMVTLQPTSGFAFSGRPQSLTGKWQYMAFGADQGFIGVVLTKWNNSMMMRDTVAYAYHALQSMAMSWTDFTIPMIYMNNDIPDSSIIILSASQAYNVQAVDNSYLYVDELNFTGTVTGISENHSDINISISPNPVSDLLILDLSNMRDKYISVNIFDVQGKLVKSIGRVEVSPKSRIEIADLPKGNYVLKISTSAGITSKKFIKHNYPSVNQQFQFLI